jgi:hypothetical protein
MTTADTTPKAGELARLTAAFLTDAGLRVTRPDPAAADDEDRLEIACRAARCALFVGDGGDAELHWSPLAHRAADAHRAAGLAAALLSGRPAARHPDAGPEVTFKGIVGMDLRAAGFTVGLGVYRDDFYFDVTADIAATDPGAGNGGTVYATDDGELTWHRDYWDDHAETAREPQFRSWLPDPAAVARAIAATVARALSVSDAVPAAR